MNASDLIGKKIAFAASGGLDSCTVTKWLAEKGVDVTCFTADLAQPDESNFDEIRKRMIACGAKEFVSLPLHDEIAEAGLEAIQSQARYEGDYWNVTGLGRYVIIEGIIPQMKERGIEVLSHGATGRGNDQVRFQIAANMLAPEISVYAPWRDPEFLSEFRGRNEMIDFCQEHSLPIKATKETPYSTDANLLGLTHEAGVLESLNVSADYVDPGMGHLPKDAPNHPEEFTTRFEAGRPVEINGEQVDAFQAISIANQVGGRHAIGIGTHLVENRFVGVKSRGIYEAPGMELLGKSYEYLIQLILDRRSKELYDTLSATYSRQIYQGYGLDMATLMAKKGIAELTKLVTGTITVSLYKGNVAFVSAKDAKHSIYSEDNASMEAVGEFDHEDSEGFLRVLSVGARALADAKQIVSKQHDILNVN